MSVENTRETMMRYFNSEHDNASMMADDVVFTVMAAGEEYRGQDGVMGMLTYFYHVAFDATFAARTTLFSEQNAMTAGDFVGKHTGEFAGIPATGKKVSVPLCVVYELEDDQIKRGRVYFEMPALFQQLGVQMGSAQCYATPERLDRANRTYKDLRGLANLEGLSLSGR